MSYTPEHPKQAENICLVRSGKNDLLNWSEDLGTLEDGVIWRDDYPENPVLKGGNGENGWEYPYVRGPSVLWNHHTFR
jgi:hypothetical protein